LRLEHSPAVATDECTVVCGKALGIPVVRVGPDWDDKATGEKVRRVVHAPSAVIGAAVARKLGKTLKASIPQAIVWHVGAMPVWDHKLVEL